MSGMLAPRTKVGNTCLHTKNDGDKGDKGFSRYVHWLAPGLEQGSRKEPMSRLAKSQSLFSRDEFHKEAAAMPPVMLGCCHEFYPRRRTAHYPIAERIAF